MNSARRLKRQSAAVLAAAGLLAVVACKSPEERSSAGDSPERTGAPSSELGPGVSDDTIKLGVLHLDLGAIADVLPSLDHGDYQSAFEAVAASINDAGGIDGRQLELVFATLDPLDQSSASAACTRLTEDEQVFAVVAAQTNATASQCILADHATPLVGGVQTAEVLRGARAPWFTWDASSASAATRTVAAVLARGDLDGKQVAVVASSADEQAANDVATLLDEGGVETVGVAVASPNISDATAARAELQTFAERFRSDGADAVIVVGEVFVVFAQALQQTDYRPELVATWTNHVLGFLVSATELDVLDGMIAGGPREESVAFEELPAQDCVRRVTAADPDRSVEPPDSPTARTADTFVSVVQACKALDLFTAIASRAGATLNADTFRDAGETLGEIELPMLGGPSEYSAAHPDGSPPMYRADWDGSLGQFVYSDTPLP